MHRQGQETKFNVHAKAKSSQEKGIKLKKGLGMMVIPSYVEGVSELTGYKDHKIVQHLNRYETTQHLTQLISPSYVMYKYKRDPRNSTE